VPYSIIARYPQPQLAEGEKKTKNNNTGPNSTSYLSVNKTQEKKVLKGEHLLIAISRDT